MSSESILVISSILWISLTVLIYRTTAASRFHSVGLPLAFVLSILLMHGGAFVHLVPQYDHNLNAYLRSWAYTKDTVSSGVFVTTIGLLGFTAGSVIRTATYVSPVQIISVESVREQARAITIVAVTGLLLSSVASRLTGVPGLSAISGGFLNITLVGTCGFIYFLSKHKKYYMLLFASFYLVLMLGISMISSGIFADTVYSSLILICFVIFMFTPRSRSVLKGAVVLFVAGYFVLLASVAWLDMRQSVRGAVWGQASLTDRIGVFIDGLSTINIFDGSSRSQLEYIDMRLNQNVIIGKAVELLEAFPDLHANGQTMAAAALSWVPRSLWAGKPERGGSAMVSYYTGQPISSSTSFGTGPFFEFFINFGHWGVILLSIIYGYILRWLDIVAARFLSDQNLIRSCLFFAPGVVMVSPLGDLFFIVNGAISSLIVAIIALYVCQIAFGVGKYK